MDSGWLLADGEAVASAQHARLVPRSPTRDALGAPRRGRRRAPPSGGRCSDRSTSSAIRDGTAVAVRCAGRRPVCVVRPGTVVVMGPGTAERHGVRRGSTVELRWAT